MFLREAVETLVQSRSEVEERQIRQALSAVKLARYGCSDWLLLLVCFSEASRYQPRRIETWALCTISSNCLPVTTKAVALLQIYEPSPQTLPRSAAQIRNSCVMHGLRKLLLVLVQLGRSSRLNKLKTTARASLGKRSLVGLSPTFQNAVESSGGTWGDAWSAGRRISAPSDGPWSGQVDSYLQRSRQAQHAAFNQGRTSRCCVLLVEDCQLGLDSCRLWAGLRVTAEAFL